jgi:hypothetical protein
LQKYRQKELIAPVTVNKVLMVTVDDETSARRMIAGPNMIQNCELLEEWKSGVREAQKYLIGHYSADGYSLLVDTSLSRW